MKRQEEIVQADVLVIGGGIAGMQAAIAAAEQGANVVVAEKSDTRRSGSAATGTDHFKCYIPEYHKVSLDEMLAETGQSIVRGIQDLDLMRISLGRSFEIAQKWESYGINMRPTGEWNFEGHTMPGKPKMWLKYNEKKKKILLTKAAKERGVTILNKVVINELLIEDNRVIGAIGINIREEKGELILFQAKTVIITTGHTMRLYPGINPAYLFNLSNCPANTGSGTAMALRAGARVANLDMPYLHAGPRFFSRSGKATWIGVYTDFYGKTVGPFVTAPTRELGDVTPDVWNDVFREKMENGTGPVYMNCSQTSQEDIDYMMTQFVSEGDTSLLDYFAQYEIDVRTKMVEFGMYENSFAAKGVEIDQTAMTSVYGLFAAGATAGNVRSDVADCAVWGQVAGENAAQLAKEISFSEIEEHHTVKEKEAFYQAMLSRQEGAYWKEANSTLQQIMGTYVGTKIRSESLLKAGYCYLADLKKYAEKQLKATDSHELMRCLEVLDLIDVAMVAAKMAENRKESRGMYHKRSDFTFTNPLLNNKMQWAQRTEDGFQLGYRNVGK